MRRVDCTGIDLTSIHVDADKIVYCQRYVTNSGSPRIAIYFSTDDAAMPLNVLELASTMADLMPSAPGSGGGEA